MPYVANYPPLRDWLAKHKARRLWQTTQDGKLPDEFNSSIELWILPNGAGFLLIIRGGKRGWDIYTECGSVDVHETLQDAEARLGVET